MKINIYLTSFLFVLFTSEKFCGISQFLSEYNSPFYAILYFF